MRFYWCIIFMVGKSCSSNELMFAIYGIRHKIERIVLGVVHNCQHLCIRTERMEGGGGKMLAYYF